MMQKIVFIVFAVGVLSTLCETAEMSSDFGKRSILLRLRDHRSEGSKNVDSNNVTSKTDNHGTNSGPATGGPTTETTTRKSTQIDDTDYWDNDEFQPYKIDNRDFFDWRLLEKAFLKDKGNVFISPFSLKFVLALLSEAADAETDTKRELSSVFYGVSSPLLLRDLYSDMLQSLREPSNEYVLNFGTKMFIRNNIVPRDQYANTLKDKYDTEIESLNFLEAKQAASTINHWCSNITAGRLQNLVNTDNVQNAVLLLVNALYFDGKWRIPFTGTHEGVFFRQPSEQIRVDYMTVTGKFYYFHSTMLNTKILRLPYKGRKFSMTILLPGAKGGLDELVRDIEGDGFRRLQWLMTEQEIKVTLPKFKLEYATQLKDVLMELGINEIFTDHAALSGIARGSSTVRKMKVTDVIQKTGIEVDESGTTAFAATDVEIVNKFGGDSLEEFIVNRPFLFLIMDESRNNMLFAGKILDPTA